MVIAKTIKKKQKDTLIPFPAEILEGKDPQGFPEGNYWIVTGNVSQIEDRDNVQITIMCGSDSLTVEFRPDHPHYRKAKSVCPGHSITVLMCGDEPAELRYGPYYGDVTWFFCNRDRKYVLTKISVCAEPETI